MSRLASAQEKLEAAVTRLEAVASGVGATGTGGDPELRKELEAMRRDHDALAAVTRKVDATLSKTITEIETALQERA